MILSTITPKISIQNPNPNSNTNTNNDLFQCPNKSPFLQSRFCCKATAFTHRPTVLTNGTSEEKGYAKSPNCNRERETARYVAYEGLGEEGGLVTSASAVAAAIRKASTSPVEFVQRIEKDGKNGLVLPSSDFQRLCVEQLDLFRRIIDSDAVLSVYVRPAGSYVMDRLELRRVTFYPGVNVTERADIVILISNFSVSTGLRVAEAALLKQHAEVIPEYRSVVFPMAKHPFVVGFLVAELPKMESGTCGNLERDGQDVQLGHPPEESYSFPPSSERKLWEIQAFKEDMLNTYHQFTAEQRLIATNISRSLATAYVMDQVAVNIDKDNNQCSVQYLKHTS